MSSALIAAGTSLLVSAITGVITWMTTRTRIRADAEAARLSQEATLRAQEERLRTELRTEFMAEEAIRALLNHPEWVQRSFDEIKHHVRGFEDNELRQLLVRSGAVAFARTRDRKEMWGLRERNLAAL
jgi:hypothetical protein